MTNSRLRIENPMTNCTVLWVRGTHCKVIGKSNVDLHQCLALKPKTCTDHNITAVGIDGNFCVISICNLQPRSCWWHMNIVCWGRTVNVSGCLNGSSFDLWTIPFMSKAKEDNSCYSSFSALQPSDFERRRALSSAICEVLWQAGNRTRCCLCLQQELPFFDTDYTYRVDGVTEKVGPFFSWSV